MNILNKKNSRFKNTMNILFVVFFCSLFFSILLVNIYGKKNNSSISLLINQKIDKVLYQFFSELITDDIINKESIGNILIITRNKNDEILTVNYDMEKTYKILTNISNILKKGITDLENGRLDVKSYDKYLLSGKNGLIINIPIFLNSKNIFVNSIGPKFPVLVNFNETLLTNIKTKVTNYGFNNALLEIYITVEMQKLLITPINKDEEKFTYDILIGALVVNGSVPNFYGGNLETNSNILDIPLT